MRTAAIRQELLTGTGADLEKRRKLVALSAIGIVDFAVITLYQSGVIKRLPELPFSAFDSNKVNADTKAYQMGAPDAAISALTYAATMVLSTWGGSKESGRSAETDVLLGATVAGNAGGALYYLYDMAFNQKKICPYCLIGAGINLASAVIAAPLFVKGIKSFFKRWR